MDMFISLAVAFDVSNLVLEKQSVALSFSVPHLPRGHIGCRRVHNLESLRALHIAFASGAKEGLA